MMYRLSLSLLLSLILMNAESIHAQGVDAKGREFQVVFMPTNGADEFPAYYLILSSDQPTTGTITYGATGKALSVTIPTANKPVYLSLDTFSLLLPDINVNEISRQSLTVRFNHEVTLWGMNTMRWSSDGFLGLPEEALGEAYMIFSYPNTIEPSPSGQTLETSDFPSQFAVVATENQTYVTITPTASINGRGNTEQFIVTLDKGEVFLGAARDSERTLRAGRDLTGTRISANRPVGVYAGQQRTNIPWNETIGRDHLVEQLPPLKFWDSAAVATPHYQIEKTLPDSNVVRVLAAYDNTSITINGENVATLNAGQVYEKLLLEGMYIQGSQPILVGQLHHSSVPAAFLMQANDSIGDPFMAIAQGVHQYQSFYAVERFESKDFWYHYANLSITRSGLENLTIDGTIIPEEIYTSFIPIPGTDYLYAQLNLFPGYHTFASTEPFGLMLYGYGPYNSYGFPAGMKFIDPPAGIADRGERPAGYQVALFPQPVVKDEAFLDVAGAARQTLSATLVDAEGKIVRRLFSDYEVYSQEEQIRIDLATLPGGYYQCQLVDRKGVQQTFPIIILR